MQYKIKHIYFLLKEGMKIKTNIDGNTHIHNFSISGEIGEIILPSIFIFNNKYEGNIGKKDPKERGYKYSWMVNINSEHGIVEFLNEKEDIIYLSVPCSKCSKNVTIDPKNIFNNVVEEVVYCEECKNIHFIKCDCCGKFYNKKSLRKDKRNKNYCNECYKRLYDVCCACKEEVLKEEMQHHENGSFCRDCFSLRFALCEICQRTCYVERIIHSEEYNVNHCNRCDPRAKDIRNYNYRPKYEFKQEKFEGKKNDKAKEIIVNDVKYIEIQEKPLFVGLELEVEPREEIVKQLIAENHNGNSGHINEALLNEAHKFKNFLKSEYLDNMFYLKYDSSVKWFEIVTQPFSIKYAHKNLKWDKILKYLVDNKFTSYSNERCGLHIHLDREYFEPNEILKLRVFFAVNQAQLFKFSKRTESMNTFAMYETLNLKKFRNDRQEGRHWALNVNTDKNTAEIRIFRGTLIYERFIASLQFSGAVASYVKHIGLGFLVKNENSWDHFIDWCKKEACYNHFVKYILTTNHKGEK
jgi:hypothetical protein